MSEQKMREALEFIRDKLRIDDEIECYDMVCEALSQREAQEPIGYTVTHGSGYKSFVWADEQDMVDLARATKYQMEPVYTDPPSREVPEDVEAAARKLADCFDYPWEYMPEQGRENMRSHARAVLLASKGGAT